MTSEIRQNVDQYNDHGRQQKMKDVASKDGENHMQSKKFAAFLKWFRSRKKTTNNSPAPKKQQSKTTVPAPETQQSKTTVLEPEKQQSKTTVPRDNPTTPGKEIKKDFVNGDDAKQIDSQAKHCGPCEVGEMRNADESNEGGDQMITKPVEATLLAEEQDDCTEDATEIISALDDTDDNEKPRSLLEILESACIANELKSIKNTGFKEQEQLFKIEECHSSTAETDLCHTSNTITFRSYNEKLKLDVSTTTEDLLPKRKRVKTESAERRVSTTTDEQLPKKKRIKPESIEKRASIKERRRKQAALKRVQAAGNVQSRKQSIQVIAMPRSPIPLNSARSGIAQSVEQLVSGSRRKRKRTRRHETTPALPEMSNRTPRSSRRRRSHGPANDKAVIERRNHLSVYI